MRKSRTIPILFATLAIVGCVDDDQRLADQAERNTQMQAQQNQEIARVHGEVAEGTRRLVSADAQARQAMLVLQQDLHRERSAIAAQRDALEVERQKIATQRQRDPIIAIALTNLGLVAACLAPLALCGYLLYCGYGRTSDEALGEVLLMDLVSDEPLLLSRAHVPDQHRLPAPAENLDGDEEPPPF